MGLGQPTETSPAPADVRMAPVTLEAPGGSLTPRRGSSVGVGAWTFRASEEGKFGAAEAQEEREEFHDSGHSPFAGNVFSS